MPFSLGTIISHTFSIRNMPSVNSWQHTTVNKNLLGNIEWIPVSSRLNHISMVMVESYKKLMMQSLSLTCTLPTYRQKVCILNMSYPCSYRPIHIQTAKIKVFMIFWLKVKYKLFASFACVFSTMTAELPLNRLFHEFIHEMFRQLWKNNKLCAWNSPLNSTRSIWICKHILENKTQKFVFV